MLYCSEKFNKARFIALTVHFGADVGNTADFNGKTMYRTFFKKRSQYKRSSTAARYSGDLDEKDSLFVRYTLTYNVILEDN